MRITESDNIMKSVSGGLETFGEYNDLAILLGESDGFAEEFAKKENLTFSEVHIHIRKIVVGDMNRPVKEKHGIVVVRFVDDKSGRYISDRISKWCRTICSSRFRTGHIGRSAICSICSRTVLPTFSTYNTMSSRTSR